MSRKNRGSKPVQQLDQSAIERKSLEQQRAVLVGVGLKSEPNSEYLESLTELMDLTETAGAEVVASTSQILEKYIPKTLIGSGKINEIKRSVEETEANLVIIDHQLSGAQSLNLEKQLNTAVIDRTQLILDIFAQRAHTHEGKLQVELAQIMDQLPRMVGAWMGSLSRQGGGIGTRGPGETALEMDRRRIRKRIEIIKKQLQQVQKRRQQHRVTRKRSKIPSFALIGYTNAGKSSLLNRLTKSNIYAKDQLFATLDPTTRKVFIPDGPQAVITDTVGFIRKLPTKLIEAFKATLEESNEADILLHIIDVSSPHMERQIEVVEELIKEFQWQDKPQLYIFNKIDQIGNEGLFQIKKHPRVLVSAKTGQGIEKLLEKMNQCIQDLLEEKELFFPKEKMHLVYDLSRDTTILKQENHSEGVVCQVRLSSRLIHKWSEYLS